MRREFYRSGILPANLKPQQNLEGTKTSGKPSLRIFYKISGQYSSELLGTCKNKENLKTITNRD